jgi:hypothetical protein
MDKNPCEPVKSASSVVYCSKESLAGAAWTTDDADSTGLHGYYTFTSDTPVTGN